MNKNVIDKVFVLHGAYYSEDGDLMTWCRPYATLEAAKKALHEDYKEYLSRWDDESEDLNTFINDNHMEWGSRSADQHTVQITESVIFLA